PPSRRRPRRRDERNSVRRGREPPAHRPTRRATEPPGTPLERFAFACGAGLETCPTPQRQPLERHKLSPAAGLPAGRLCPGTLCRVGERCPRPEKRRESGGCLHPPCTSQEVKGCTAHACPVPYCGSFCWPWWPAAASAPASGQPRTAPPPSSCRSTA